MAGGFVVTVVYVYLSLQYQHIDIVVSYLETIFNAECKPFLTKNTNTEMEIMKDW